MAFVIKLTDIPEGLLALINDSSRSYEHAYLKEEKIKGISIFEDQYNIVTLRSEYRISLNTDVVIEIR